MSLQSFLLTQTAVGHDNEGMRRTAAKSFLTPGLDGYGSFGLLYVRDWKRWVHLDDKGACRDAKDTETDW